MSMIRHFIMILMLFSSTVAKASVVVNSSVDRNKMGEGDTFTLSVTVSSENSVSISEPRLPTIEGFDLINTWTESENYSTFINGRFQVQRKQNYHYMLAPQKTGTFKIEGITVNINGKDHITKPIEITVVAGTAAPPPSPSRRQRAQTPFDDVDDLFSQFLRRRPTPGYRAKPVDPDEAFFIQVEVDKTEVYVGEQVVASFYLYTRAQITDIDTLNYPSLNGFWKEDIEVATRLGFQDEVINGIVYRKALLASYALFPIKTGVTKVDTYRAKCTVVSPTAFGFGQPTVITKQSPEVEIQVKSLPSNSTGVDYIGGVGNFKMSSVSDSSSLSVNQPLTWKLKFHGQGNAKLIELPKVSLPEGLELYDTKVESSFNKNGQSRKEFELLVIPRKPGNYELPPLSFALFNPDNASYYVVNSLPLALEVIKGEDDEVLPSQPLAKNIENQDESSRVLFPEIILTNWQPSWVQMSSLQVVSIWSGGVLLSLFALLFYGYRELGEKQKKKDLEAVLKNKFKKVNQHLDAGNWRRVGVEMMNTFYFLIGEIAGQGGASLEVEKMMEKVPPSVRRELGADLLKNLKKFEMISFAPEDVVGDLKNKAELKKSVVEMEDLLNRAVKLGLGKFYHD